MGTSSSPSQDRTPRERRGDGARASLPGVSLISEARSGDVQVIIGGGLFWAWTSPSPGDVTVTALEESALFFCESTIVIHDSSVAEPP